MAIEIRKNYGYTASILENTNKVVASSKAEWDSVQKGNLISIGEDEDFLKIASKEKFFFIKDALVNTRDELLIEENTNIRLTVDDDITITHKEYELSTFKIKSAGNGYEVGDILKAEGGTCKYNSSDEIDIPTEFKVEKVNNKGGVTSLSIFNKGVYTSSPSKTSNLLNGIGAGAQVTLEYSLLEERTIEDRSITHIYFEGDTTKIKLNHPLPPRVKEVKVSVNKHMLLLDVNYPHESKFNVPYQIIKDFSGHLNIPFMYKDSRIKYQVYNEAIYKLDQKIKQLEKRIDELEE